MHRKGAGPTSLLFYEIHVIYKIMHNLFPINNANFRGKFRISPLFMRISGLVLKIRSNFGA